MPRNLVIVIVVACAVVVATFVGIAALVGPNDDLGQPEWATQTPAAAPPQPLLRQENPGAPGAGGAPPAEVHGAGPGSIPGGTSTTVPAEAP